MFSFLFFKTQSSPYIQTNWDYVLSPSWACAYLLAVRADIAVNSWKCPVLNKGCCAHLSLCGKKRSVGLKSEFTKLKLQITLLFKHHYTSHLYIDCKRLYFRPVNRAKNQSQHRKRFKFLAVLDVAGAKWLMEK